MTSGAHEANRRSRNRFDRLLCDESCRSRAEADDGDDRTRHELLRGDDGAHERIPTSVPRSHRDIGVSKCAE